MGYEPWAGWGKIDVAAAAAALVLRSAPLCHLKGRREELYQEVKE